ncbi:MAG: hypothetical protein ACK476_16640 [Fluviicola sp.]
MRAQHFILFIVFLVQHSFAQDLSFQWGIPCDSLSIWSVDNLNNLIVQENGTLSKYSSKGQKTYEQSIKQTGDFSSIDGGNGLKIGGFSTEQQQICFFDNTLTLQNECVDLSDFEITTATAFCMSEQTDKFWVYDEMKSELSLMTLRTNQQQKLDNIRNLSTLKEVVRITEFNNQLFLFDRNHILVLDIFGSFLKDLEIDLTGILDFQISDEFIYLLKRDHTFEAVNLITLDRFPINFTIKEAQRFVFKNGFFYFQSTNQIDCYEVIIKN